MDKEILDCIDSWLIYLHNIKNYSENTVASYKFDIDSFFDHLLKANDGSYTYEDFISVSNLEIRGWLFARKNLLQISHRSNLRALSALKSLVRYLNTYRKFPNTEVLSINLRSGINFLPKHISLESILMIIDNMENKIMWIKKRNQTLIILLYATGLRISEALSLKLSDFIENKSIKVKSKGNKERVVPLIDNVSIKIKEYVQYYPFAASSNSYIFCNKNGTQLSRISVARLLKNLREKLGLSKNVTAHGLRHSFATHLINEDVDLRDIQALLGHKNISSTEIYAKVETCSLIKNYNKFHPSNE